MLVERIIKKKSFTQFNGCNFIIIFQQVSMTRTTTPPMFIIISCGCCFLQSTIALIILLPNIYIRKCYISFLKMQFCASVSTTMAILILGLLKLLPQVSLNDLLFGVFDKRRDNLGY